MSGGQSSSKSASETTTTTEQRDERVSATDLGVAIGANTQLDNVSFEQIPPAVADAFTGVLHLAQDSFNLAQEAGQAALDAKDGTTSTSRQFIIIGSIVLVVIVGIIKK